MEREERYLDRQEQSMDNFFSETELSQLKNYRFTLEKAHQESDLSITLSELLQKDQLRTFISRASEHIGSPNVKVTASMFIKRYAFLSAIYLYAMTAFNKRFHIQLEHMHLQTDEQDPLWLPSFYFSEWSISEPTGDRDQWRYEAIADFFSNIVTPIVESVKTESKQSKLVLWENIAIYIFWLYESVLSENEDEEVCGRAVEDLHFIAQQAPGSLFGRYHENPIKKHFHEKRYIPELGEEVRVRTTCCFFYALTGTTDRCKICPQTCNRPKKVHKNGGNS